MGCIRSKPIRDQVKEEDRCVYEGPEESYSSELKPDLLIQQASFESSSDVGCLETELEFEEDSAIAANEFGAEPAGPIVPSDVSPEDRSSDGGEDDLTVEMQLLREITKLQMAALRMARNRLYWSIIQRDAMIVSEALEKSQSFFEESAEEDGPTCRGGEMSLKNGDAIESTQTQSEPVNGIVIWVLDVVLDDIDYDSLNDGGKDEELITDDDEDADLSDFEYFQFQRTNRFRMTIRRPRKSPPSPLKVCTESNLLEQKASTEQNKLPPSAEMDISGASTSTRDIDSEKEKSISKDIKLFPENTIDDASTSTRDIDSEKEKSISKDIKLFPENTIGDTSTSTRDIDSEKEKSISKDIKLFPENTIASTTMTTEVLLSVPECTVQSTSDNDHDPTMIENGGGLVNGHDDFNEPDNVTSNDITSEPSQSDDEETRIDEEREKRRLQWLARRKSTIPSAYVQPDISLDAKPREIDIDSVMARKKCPWMR